jgi:hypothetical protein
MSKMLSKPTPRPEVFKTYWWFAAERQRIFDRRLVQPDGPWTTDEVLAEFRFCNTFRASDRVTQDLVRVAYSDESFTVDDIFIRVMLHRLFSRPATFELLEAASGGLRKGTFDVGVLGATLDRAFAAGERLYTSAFILCANPAFGHKRKHQNHLVLVDEMVKARVPESIAEAASMRDVYDLLRAWPLLGPFMAYQLAIDLNYTTILDFDEDDFTVPGPGALRGLTKVFLDLGDLTPAEAIHWLVAYQDDVESTLGFAGPRLFDRPLHAIDCQNLLCEVDKYCRAVLPDLQINLTRIKQRFRHDTRPLELFFPPKWGLAYPRSATVVPA